MTPEGLTRVESRFSPSETAERLVAAVTSRGMALMARVDHAAAAATAGLELPPTEVLMFGNPRAGTPMMAAARTAGIDLPLKALIWLDGGKTWIAYNEPQWIAARHGFSGDVAAMSGALAAVVREAAGTLDRQT